MTESAISRDASQAFLEGYHPPGSKESLSDLQKKFVNRYFPDGGALPSPLISSHDAAHEWSNIDPTFRGELQQFIVDLAGSQELAKRIGARGIPNSVDFSVPSETFLDDNAFKDYASDVRVDSNTQLKSLASSKGLTFEQINSPSRFQQPPISEAEMGELMKRGREFYGKIADSWTENLDKLDVPKGWIGNPNAADMHSVYTEMPFDNGQIQSMIPVNRAAYSIHTGPSILKVDGGYKTPNSMPYGPREKLMNTPLEIGYDESEYRRIAYKKAMDDLMKKAVDSNSEKTEWKTKSALNELSEKYGMPEFNASLGPRDFNQILDEAKATGGDFEEVANKYMVNRYIEKTLPEWKGIETGTMRSIVDTSNPSSFKYIGDDIIAKMKELKMVRNAVRTGTRAAADLTSSIPLADSEFQLAIESRDPLKAAGIVARDIAIGAAAAPIVGLGTGAVQRSAPQLAARLIPVIGQAGRIGNPVTTLTQLGGDQRQNARVRAAAFKARPQASGGMGPSADPQLLIAEAARRKPGKWGINTPFGRLTLPDLGITESKGIHFR